MKMMESEERENKTCVVTFNPKRSTWTGFEFTNTFSI